MRSLAAAAALAVLALPGLAAAEGSYFSFGGGPTAVEDELSAHTGDGGRMRLAIGHRVGNVAVEAFVAPEFYERGLTSGVGLGVDARYILPVSSGLQLYVRGSMSRLSTSLDTDPDRDDRGYGGSWPSTTRDYAGRGLGGGVGVQLRGRVRALGFLYWPMFFIPVGPKVNAALFMDHGYDFYRLHSDDGRGGSLDARVTRLTIGFNVGSDF